MRLLVTGANGLVGGRLCALLASRGHQVVGVSRGERRPSTSPAAAFEYRSVELADRGQVAQALEASRPDVVVHTASMTEVDACEKDPDLAFACNVEAPANVARAARKLGAHLVHVSTDYVFDGDAGPYTEDDVPNPRGVYALTKHMGEQAVRVFAGSYAIARTAVVYGWPPAGRPNFGAWLVGALSKGEKVKLFEDQFVSPSLALSVAEMLAELAERRLAGVWNTCGGEVVDRVSFGRALCAELGFDASLLVPTRMAALKLPSPRPYKSGLVTDKARAQLSAKPLPLSEALPRFHTEYRTARGAS